MMLIHLEQPLSRVSIIGSIHRPFPVSTWMNMKEVLGQKETHNLVVSVLEHL